MQVPEIDLNFPDKYGKTPLMYCGQYNCGESAMALLDAKADFRIETPSHKTCMIYAAQDSGVLAAIEMIKAGASVYDKNSLGLDVLHFSSTPAVKEDLLRAQRQYFVSSYEEKKITRKSLLDASTWSATEFRKLRLDIGLPGMSFRTANNIARHLNIEPFRGSAIDFGGSVDESS